MTLTYEYILSLKPKYTNSDVTLANLISSLKKSLNTETVVNWRSDKPRFLKKKEESSETILKNEINTNLNKLSPKNFDNISKTIINNFILKNNNALIVNYTIENLFLKAILQPTYCPYYVKFMKLLIANNININKIITEKCNAFSEIVKNNSSKEPVAERKNGRNSAYDEFCNLLKEKKRKAGYSQFIGELFNNGLIPLEILIKNMEIFIGNIEDLLLTVSKCEEALIRASNGVISEDFSKEIAVLEDNLICVCKLFETVRHTEFKRFKDNLILIKSSKYLSKRLKFMLLDIIEKKI